jgi:hypothetical protein
VRLHQGAHAYPDQRDGIEASKLNALEKHVPLYFPHINSATAI